LSDGKYLIYERAYNLSGDAPVDSWETSNILNGTFWYTGGSGTGVCSTYGAFETLSYFNSNCYNGGATVTSLTAFLGYTQSGSFYGAVDNIAFGAENFGPVIWDFETDAPTDVVPEPASMALLATGLAGMAAARRKRRQA
jgi:hypothetical protein